MTKKKGSGFADMAFFTFPTLIVFSLAVFIPFIYGFIMTFMEMATVISPMEFTGLGNYIEAFDDKMFWDSLLLTFKYVAASVLLVNAVGFALAYLVTSGLKGQNFFRTALFTPNLIGGLVLGYIWQFIFVQTLPAIGKALGIELIRLGWLGDPDLAFWSIVIVTVWQFSGYMMIIFIAGLVSIPRDVIEASVIDGAGSMRRLISVTMPLMMPAFVVTLFLTIQRTFMVYDLNYSLTAGGPFHSTRMASMHIVNKAFVETSYSVGQAEAILLFVFVVAITGLQVYIGKKREVEA